VDVRKEVAPETHLEAVYTVERIAPEDIKAPSDRFVRFLQRSKHSANGLTLEAFVEQVKERFVSSQ
jgi:hypothetical protein